MFVDASALVAILTREAGHDELEQRLHRAPRRITSGLAMFEAVVAIARRTGLALDTAETLLRSFMGAAEIGLVPITDAEAGSALAAYARFGKGRGHPAQLNMGDCFAYACSRNHDVPLLFVGDDFTRTDIPQAS
ncbi:type II toxin-antitoxin system VapC family toxin [uncultured Methylobacterium sp.]|jgi:ribonuclease VapC|uniref:type II toxin-antitoxin system VapC family toxin n=1 Tax=uncultured Methylobacterium sp. TaxID=157278 RepID=UPI002625B4C2|nr:type II toxin-antitoxin system VapC family toxin [uncultured Methylobacterium sp.]